MASDKFTAAQVITALEETRGMITLAARKLNCSPNTIRRYIKEYPTVADAKFEARESLGDSVELTLIDQALGKRDTKGEYRQPPNIAALIFLAKTKYKDRGYVERQETWNINVPPELMQKLVTALEANNINPSDTFEEMIRTLANAEAAVDG